MKNLGLKALSVAIALMLAYFVHREGNISEVGFVVPVLVQDVPAGKVVLGAERAQAQVLVRGPSFLVTQIPLSPPVARISIRDDVLGVQRVRLTKADFSLPPGIEIVDVTPGEIEITVDELIEKTLPVVVPQIGTVNTGFTLEELILSPDKVAVKGPATMLATLSRIESEPVDLRGAQEPGTQILRLRAPVPQVELNPLSISVQLKVVSKQLERRVANVPIKMKGKLSPRLALGSSVASVNIKGLRELVKEVEVADIELVAEVTPKSVVGEKITLKVKASPKVEIVAVEPSVVEVIEISPSRG